MNNIRNSKIYIYFKNSFINLILFKLRKTYSKATAKKNNLIVIEGFPRSANTFIFNIFKKSLLEQNIDPQGKIGHHIHTIAQVKYAIKNNIPTLIIIRAPDQAIASYVLKKYGTSSIKNIEQILVNDLYYWIYFYSNIYKLKKYVVISNFYEVINNYDITIEKINEKYNTNFKVIEPSLKNSREVLDSIRQLNLPKANFDERLIAVPSEKKEYDKNRIRMLVHNSKYYLKANELYELINKYCKID